MSEEGDEPDTDGEENWRDALLDAVSADRFRRFSGARKKTRDLTFYVGDRVELAYPDDIGDDASDACHRPSVPFSTYSLLSVSSETVALSIFLAVDSRRASALARSCGISGWQALRMPRSDWPRFTGCFRAACRSETTGSERSR